MDLKSQVNQEHQMPERNFGPKPRYKQRTTLTCCVEWELLNAIRKLANERRLAISEIVSDCFTKYVNQKRD